MAASSISSTARQRVAVLVGLSTDRARDILRGVIRYNQPGWRWEIRQQFDQARHCESARLWGAHGIIANAFSPELIHSLQRIGVPVVNVSSRVAGQPFSQVIPDNLAIGRLAAEYFLDRGYRNYACLVETEAHFADLRSQGFRQRLKESGFSASVQNLEDELGVFAHWEAASEPLSRWLRSLPTPVAIFSDDVRGPILCQTCQRIGMHVPEQAAILGTNNEELHCELVQPPMSSIALANQEVGYQAAKLLDSLMGGQAPPAGPILIPPTAVITRASTDIFAIDDTEVAAAMRYITTHAHRRIKAGDVVKATAISRRVLESRFRKVMGRTLLQEIHRVCVECAKLLTQTNKSLPDVARDSGFRDNPHLWLVFHRMTGMSPQAYRKSHSA